MNLVVSIATLFFSIRHLYIWSAHAEEYVNKNQKKRKEMRKSVIYMPQYIFFDAYDANPDMEIWVNRIIGIVFLIASITIFWVSILGPV